ncbi:MAG: ABC transporter permease [Bryobacteraceae bacterium]|jgi:putative ABC transport system permease protein
MPSAWKDLRYAARALRRNPGFTLAAVTAMALGIGANTAIFSVLYAVLLRSLPFPHADRLALLTESRADGRLERTGAPYPDYAAWSSRTHAFEAMAAYWNVSGDGAVLGGSAAALHVALHVALRVRYTIATNSFFAILGARPAIGRGFLDSEQQPGAAKVFLASNALWHRTLGGAADAIGKPYRIDGEAYTLIGVLPAAFDFPRNCDLWLPLGALEARQLTDRISHPFWALGRLRPGVSLSRAHAELAGIERQLAEAHPETAAHWRVNAIPLSDELAGNIRASLLVLFGAAVFMLLIACVNVANLLLARSAAREREFAIRCALGAGRIHLLRQALSESLLIAVCGGCAGLLLAFCGLRGLAALSSSSASGSLPTTAGFTLNAPALAFAALLMAAVAIVMGLAPLLQSSNADTQEALRGRTAGVRGRRTRSILVVVEVSLTVLLLIGAGLMLRTLLQLRKVDPGFRTDRLLSMKVTLPDTRYASRAQRTAFLDRALDAIRTLPGVDSVAAVNHLPMSGDRDWGSFNVVGQAALDWGHAPSAEGRSISANYFRAMGIPLLQGRDFEPGAADAAGSVIVNRAFAREYWPDQNPIGQRLMSLDEQPRTRVVVGVVGDVKHFGLDAAADPEMYTLYGWWRSMTLVVRCADSAPDSMASAVRRRIAALDPEAPLYDVALAEQLVDRSTAPRRLDLLLLGIFAALALLLAVVGIYGLLAYAVGRRTREIGIRLALGARPAGILRLVIGEGMRLVLGGLAIGTLASLALTQLMQSLLYGVKPTDPMTFGAVAILLTAAGALACYLPARRAMKIDPLTALRVE